MFLIASPHCFYLLLFGFLLCTAVLTTSTAHTSTYTAGSLLCHVLVTVVTVVILQLSVDSLILTLCTNKSSAVAEMGDHLAVIDMGRKLWAVPLFWGELGPRVTQCRLDQGLPPYQVAS